MYGCRVLCVVCCSGVEWGNEWEWSVRVPEAPWNPLVLVLAVLEPYPCGVGSFPPHMSAAKIAG